MVHIEERDMGLARPGRGASSSLVPMLTCGLILILIGMVVAYAMS